MNVPVDDRLTRTAGLAPSKTAGLPDLRGRISAASQNGSGVPSVNGNGQNGNGAEKPNGLFTDTCNFLDGREAARMSLWAYLNGGREHLERFFEQPDYDGKIEEGLIPIIANQFAGDLPDKISLIELGPGKAYSTKTKAFIEAFNEAAGGSKRIVEYQALDVVEDYASEAASYVSNEFKITSSGIVADFTKMREQIETLASPVLISWNSPIWNSPIPNDVESDFVYANNMKRIGQILGPGGIAILTHFPMRDPDKTRGIYLGDNCQNAVMAIPGLIQKRLNPTCTTASDQTVQFKDMFNYDVYLDDDNELVKMNLVVGGEEAIDVTMGDYEANLQPRQWFTAVQSAKPGIKRFNRIANLAGADIINTAQAQGIAAVGQALQFNRN